MSSDAINALLHVAAAGFVSASVARAVRDRMVRGVSPWTACFMSIVSWWSAWTYSCGGLPFSAAGAMALGVVNTFWSGLLVVFTVGERQKEDRLRRIWYQGARYVAQGGAMDEK